MTRRRNSSAFTLLEIMIAVTIFSILALVIFAVFRGAVRSTEAGERETNMLQRSRFALDAFAGDVERVFFRDETSYNVAISRLVEQMEQERLRAEDTGDWSTFESLYGKPDDDPRDRNHRTRRDDDENETQPAIGDPYEKGRIIDLQLIGTNGSEADTLKFTMASPLAVGRSYRPFGLSRVAWTVASGNLVRTAEPIDVKRRDTTGATLGTNEPPEVAKMADGVLAFDLTYAFWFDNKWYESDSWNSAQRQIRNPRYILGTYDRDPDRPDDDLSIQPGDPGWNAYLNDLESEPLDRLPQYVRVRLKLQDLKNKERVATFERLIRLPGAVETYSPADDVDEDRRLDERNERGQKYVEVFPGASQP